MTTAKVGDGDGKSVGAADDGRYGKAMARARASEDGSGHRG